MKALEWTLERLKERSTWAGLGVLLGLIGMKVSPEVLGGAMGVVVSVIGLYEVIRKEGR